MSMISKMFTLGKLGKFNVGEKNSKTGSCENYEELCKLKRMIWKITIPQMIG